MSFSFKCISCGRSTFSVDSDALLYGGVAVATFICPHCNECNAVQARPGGGLVVAIDKQVNSQMSDKKP